VKDLIDDASLDRRARHLEVPRIFWHRELPPFDAVPIGEHVVEATSGHVPATLEADDALWGRCRQELIAEASRRLAEEMRRLGGRYAHVLEEAVETHHDPVSGEAWLRGRFRYQLYS
jgi:hypothetical protein